MITVRVNIRTPGLDQAAKTLGGMGRNPPPPVVAQMYDGWAKRYEVFIRRRYNAFSRGGGDWPPLALSTIQARNRRSSPARGRGPDQFSSLARVTRGRNRGKLVQSLRQVAILKDTGTLFNALTVGAVGNVKQYIPYGVRFGVGGPAIHVRRVNVRPIGAGGKPGRAVRGLASSRLTIGRLAAIHDQGEGHNPRRRIIVPPDQATLNDMSAIAKRMLSAAFNNRTGGGR